MNKKVQLLGTVLCTLAVIGCFAVNNAFFENQAVEAGIVGLIVSALIGVIIAGALGPTIFEQIHDLENDTGSHLSTGEENLIGTWTLLIIVGVMMAIISMAI